MKWFAERADLIIIMFDAHKLDISDELKGVMELMIPHLDKMRIVLKPTAFRRNNSCGSRAPSWSLKGHEHA
jgi:hypothetical protein